MCVCARHAHMHLEASWKCYWDKKGAVRWGSLGTVLLLVGLNTSVSLFLLCKKLQYWDSGLGASGRPYKCRQNLMLSPLIHPGAAQRQLENEHTNPHTAHNWVLSPPLLRCTHPLEVLFHQVNVGCQTQTHFAIWDAEAPQEGVGQPQSNLKETEPCTAILPPSQQEASNKDPFLWVVFFSPTLH